MFRSLYRVWRVVRFSLLILPLGALVGCYAVAIPPQDDAVPVPRHSFHGSYFVTTGMNMNSTIYIDKKLNCADKFYNKSHPTIAYATGGRLTYAITHNLSLNTQLWISGYSAELYAKYTFLTKPFYLALLPGIVHHSSQDDTMSINAPAYHASLNSTCFNIPLAMTYEAPSLGRITLVVRESIFDVDASFRHSGAGDRDSGLSRLQSHFSQNRSGAFLSLQIDHELFRPTIQFGIEHGATKYGNSNNLLLFSLRADI